MHESLLKHFTPEILEFAAAGWGSHAADAIKISEVENFVFELRTAGAPVILRITHQEHRSSAAIEAELRWIADLAARGVHVARPIVSQHGNLVESHAPNGVAFHAAAFSKLNGREMRGSDPELWNAQTFREWGRVAGTLHALVQNYPAHEQARRHEWCDDESIVNAHRYFPAGHRAHEEVDRLLDWMRALPQPAAQYGLVHADLHPGNFLVENGALQLFDFDDCCRHWFMYDLAVIINSAMRRTAPLAERTRQANTFLQPFLEGYASAYPLDHAWLRHIPEFMRYRDVLLFATVLKWWAPARMTDAQRKYIETIDHDLSHDVPVAELAIE